MKIAMILDDSFPPDPRVENEASTLIEAGHNVDLYSISYDKSAEKYEELNGITVFRMMVPKYFRSLSALAYSNPLYHFLYERKLKNVFNPGDYDAVHIHDMVSARSVFRLLKNYRGLKILDLHENRPEIMKFYEHVNSSLGKLLINPKKWKSFEKQYIGMADKVIVVTDAAKEYYSEIYDEPNEKFAVVPNSVSSSFFESPDIDSGILKKHEDKFVLLYVGDTGERRGIGDVLQAVAILKEEIKNLIFVCVGNSKSDESWQRMIESNSLEDHVELMGWQDFAKFPSLISSGDVCLSPLHKNVHHDTTYANKLFQYMSMKKPVVVSDCIAQADVVRNSNCGLVYEASNVFELAKCIKELYDNPKQRNEMGENGYQAVRDTYNWEKVSENLTAIYK